MKTHIGGEHGLAHLHAETDESRGIKNWQIRLIRSFDRGNDLVSIILHFACQSCRDELVVGLTIYLAIHC